MGHRTSRSETVSKCAVRGKNGPEAGASQMGQGCRGEPYVNHP